MRNLLRPLLLALVLGPCALVLPALRGAQAIKDLTLAGNTTVGGTLNASTATGFVLPSSATFSGTWTGAQGGTGVANTGKTITLGGNVTTSGAYPLTLTQTGNTTVTLPTFGTLLTLNTQSERALFANIVPGPAVWQWQPVATADLPTVTTTDSATPSTTTLTGSTFIRYSDPRFQWMGGIPYDDGNPNDSYWKVAGLSNASGTLNTSTEFYVSGTAFEVLTLFGGYRIWIDGKVVPRTTLSSRPRYGTANGTTTTQTTGVLDTYTFTTERTRKVRLDFPGTRFGGLRVAYGSAFQVSAVPRRPRVVFVGDSLVEGTGTADSLLDFPTQLGAKMGWDVFRNGIGSTGYNTATASSNYVQRAAADIIAPAPDAVIIWGSINDSTLTTAIVGGLYDRIRSGLPHAKIYVIGLFWPTTPFGGDSANQLVIAAACAARGIPFINPAIAGSEWFNSTTSPYYYGGTGATGTAAVAAGAVTGVTLTAAGTLYPLPPRVTLSGGGGSGAIVQTTANLSVKLIELLSGGAGYTSAPTVSIAGTAATATAARTSTAVSSVTITSGGFYDQEYPPTVSFTGGGGSGATATCTLDTTGAVQRVVVTAGGTGYTSDPTVVFTATNGTGATATATVSGGAVTALTVTAEGSGYTRAPGIKFSGGAGAGVLASPRIFGPVTGFTVVSGGTGYSTAPTVTVVAPADGPHFNQAGHDHVAEKIAFALSQIAAGSTAY